MARCWWEGQTSQHAPWWARTDPGQPQLVTVPHCMANIPLSNLPAPQRSLFYSLFWFSLLSLFARERSPRASERARGRVGHSRGEECQAVCKQGIISPLWRKKGYLCRPRRLQQVPPRARLWAGDPCAYGESSHRHCCLLHPLLRYTPRALIRRSHPQSDRRAGGTASAGRDCWTPARGPSGGCHPGVRASSLRSPLLHTRKESNTGNVYSDASLQLQFTSSLTASLQR